MKKAIVLLSGGLDSTTVLGYVKKMGFEPLCISFSYGQRHSAEIKAIDKVLKHFDVKYHMLINLPLSLIGGSALTDPAKEVPKGKNIPENEIPITYVPARNIIFLSYALAVAEVKKVAKIFIGVSSVDYSGYPDCRPEFIEAFNGVAKVGTKLGTEEKSLEIHAPLMTLTKAETIKLGLECGVDYSLTHTCYDPDERGRACGECDSCRLRLKAFHEVGIKDPVEYQ